MNEQELDYLRFVPNVHFEQIPIKNLVSNQVYQRNLSIKHVQKAAENFDPYQINPVKVSRRDGINYVFNGQHTIEIIALVSGSRETPVWCMIYDDLVYEKEADIFANQQKYVKSLLPYEIFIANLESGSDKHVIINDLVESYDLFLTSSTTPGGICAVATIEQIYDKYGYHVLDRTLRLSTATWEGENHSYSANVLNGIAKMINAYGDLLHDNIFKQKLSEVSIKELIRTAKERRSGSLGYAEAMVNIYNKRLKDGSQNALPMHMLYTKKINTKPHLSEQEEAYFYDTPFEKQNADEDMDENENGNIGEDSQEPKQMNFFE